VGQDNGVRPSENPGRPHLETNNGFVPIVPTKPACASSSPQAFKYVPPWKGFQRAPFPAPAATYAVPWTGQVPYGNCHNRLPLSHSIADGKYTLIGGQHIAKAVVEWRVADQSPHKGVPLPKLPQWMREVNAQVLKRGTPPEVCAAAAGRHQRQQMRTTASSTSQHCRHFCVRLKGVDVDTGLKLDVVVKILMDSGIPLENLLGKQKRKKAPTKTPTKKGKEPANAKDAVVQRDDSNDPITKKEV